MDFVGKFLNRSNKRSLTLSNEIDLENLPSHIAIIMDGNGRWANKRGLPRTVGHRAGVEALRGIIRYCAEIKIRYLTLYAFSTENWSRPDEEVTALMGLVIEYLNKEIKTLHSNNIKINILGDLTKLPENTRVEVEKGIATTQGNTGLQVNIAMNYGGRQEIIKAVKDLYVHLDSKSNDLEEITEELFAEFLYTRSIPDPDLVIRPSGELRLSNFLLWQVAYSELWFSDILWPDFNSEHLCKAIIDYQKRDRRFGKVK